MYRHKVTVEAGSWYRTDTASGTSTPTTVFAPDGVTVVGNVFAGSGSTVKVNTAQGTAEFVSSVQTLYLKRLTYKGSLSGDTPITSVGVDLTQPPAPLSPSDVASIVARLPGTYAPITGSPRYGNATQNHVYNLKPKHLFRTRAKLAACKAGTGTLKVTTAGHSIVAGTGATIGTNDWPTLFKAELVSAGFPSAGTGLVAAARAGSSITTPADSRWSFGSGWSAFGQGSNLVTNSTTTNAATFTSDVAGTRVDVYYYNGGGAFTVSIDGGTAVAVTPPGGASLGTYTVTGLTNTTHSVAIVRTSGNCIFLGVEVWNNGAGIRMHNAGQSGQVTAVTGLSNTTWYASCPLAGSTTGWNSDLAFLMCIANDAFASVSVATWQANMQTAINGLKANSQDVVLLNENPINTLDFSAYTAALYALADSNDLPLIDFSARWTSYTLANSYGIMSDGTHPNGTGYADYARALRLALGL